MTPFLYAFKLTNINRFSKLFTVRIKRKRVIILSLMIPPHLKCVATLSRFGQKLLLSSFNSKFRHRCWIRRLYDTEFLPIGGHLLAFWPYFHYAYAQALISELPVNVNVNVVCALKQKFSEVKFLTIDVATPIS